MSKEQSLTNEELTELVNIIRKFSRLSDTLEAESNKLSFLEEQKSEITKNLRQIKQDIEECRDTEKVFLDSLKDKYGSVKLNLETFQLEDDDEPK